MEQLTQLEPVVDTPLPIKNNPQFGLVVTVAAGVVTVTYAVDSFRQNILSGDESDYQSLVKMIEAEKYRMIAEIETDVASGQIDPSRVQSFSDLHDQCDANMYIAGGRTESGSWSDEKTDLHHRALLSKGLIGKGLETVDEKDIYASESFTGFQNAAAEGVNVWLKNGGLTQASARRLGR